MRCRILLFVFTVAVIAAAQTHYAANSYTGVWTEGDDSYHLWVGQNWNGFEKKWRELAKKNLRLVDLEVYNSGKNQRYTGVWRKGSDKHYLWVGKNWKQFEKKWKQLSKKKLRLIDLEVYQVNKKTRYAGVWRAGSDSHYLWVGKSWKKFESKWRELAEKKLRLIDIETYVEKGKRRYAGVWRRGTGKHYLYVGKSWGEFKEKWSELAKKNLRLEDLEIYEVAGKKKYAGVWRAGKQKYALWSNVDFENFEAKWRANAAKGLRLIDIESYPGCKSSCANQVSGGRSYNRKVAATKIHCQSQPALCPTPGAGDVVGYRRPVDVVGEKEYPRLGPLHFKDQIFTLPFKDKKVNFSASWIYAGGSHHYAVDYSRGGEDSFKVVATAPGRVIYIGWQWNSGNTVVISHGVKGKRDAYRTIYMHLRDGPKQDCKNAWAKSISVMASDSRLENYQEYLEDTGCTDSSNPKPDKKNWGKSSEDIANILNKRVKRGQFIGWAGNTGPGGRGDTDQINRPNHHLHIKFARRDADNGLWYLFDPYGIYGKPDCYPDEVEGNLSGACVRYPVAWQGGRPERP